MSRNRGLFPDATHLIRPVAISVLAAALFTFIASRILRNRHRGALATTIFIALLTYGENGIAKPVANFASQAMGFSMALEPLLLVMFAAAFLAVGLSRISPTITFAANVWAVLVFLVYPATWGPTWFLHIWDTNETEYASPPNVFSDAKGIGELPDIYHITLDGYTRGDILQEMYGFDNSDFVNGIRGMGFAVADRATTPYNQTRLAMLSVFEGSYLHQYGKGENSALNNYGDRLGQRYRENSVFRTLSRMGYRITATRNQYGPVDVGRDESVAPRPWFELTFFERALFEQNALSLFAQHFDFLQSGEVFTASIIRDAYDVPFNMPHEQPFLLYTHQIAPHPPFDISRNGDRRKTVRLAFNLLDGFDFHQGIQSLRSEYKAGYLEKIRFINNETTEYLARLIREMPDPKIIILHGDHGGGLYGDRDSLEGICVRERFSPLLALYSSDGRLQDLVDDELNLVNIYRLIFNTYFNTELPLLESENYFATYARPAYHGLIKADEYEKSCLAAG